AIGKLQWQDVVIACELKCSKARGNDNVLVGQLMQDFIDMAASQPRRFMIGLSVAEQGK
ncbi:hypothetical protein EV182_006351, partial [Spiromyces aspiralis]